MFIDDITIKVRAGSGGRGAVAFNKNLHQYGPAGGSGGEGGDVYVEGVSNLGILSKYRFSKEFYSENGQDGRGQFCDGINAEDLTLYVPVGTVIHNLTTGSSFDITSIGERVLLARGKRRQGELPFSLLHKYSAPAIQVRNRRRGVYIPV